MAHSLGLALEGRNSVTELSFGDFRALCFAGSAEY